MYETTAKQQIALQQKLHPLLLGNGKLARHLHHYFHLLKIPHQHFENARDLESPEILRQLNEVNAVWILTSDHSIPEIKIRLETRIGPEKNKRMVWIHSSAASEIDGMITLHPLMTFSESLYSQDQYEQIPFACIGTSLPLHELLGLSNPSFPIASEQRALYHAFAVTMSNLPVLLWSWATKQAKTDLQLPFETYSPILKQTLENFLNHGAKALTGPIARGDQQTIAKNLTALQHHSPKLANIYQSFLETKIEPQQKMENTHDHRT